MSRGTLSMPCLDIKLSFVHPNVEGSKTYLASKGFNFISCFPTPVLKLTLVDFELVDVSATEGVHGVETSANIAS